MLFFKGFSNEFSFGFFLFSLFFRFDSVFLFQPYKTKPNIFLNILIDLINFFL